MKTKYDISFIMNIIENDKDSDGISINNNKDKSNKDTHNEENNDYINNN